MKVGNGGMPKVGRLLPVGRSTFFPPWNGLSWLLVFILFAGCSFPVREEVDRVVRDLAAQPLDLTPTDLSPTDHSLSMDPSKVREPNGDSGVEAGLPRWQPARFAPPGETDPKDAPAPPPRSLAGRLKIPADLPGAGAPPLKLPPFDTKKKEERDEALKRLFPELPSLPSEPVKAPGPEGKPLSLSDLQRLALSNSPVIRQASADVEAARGAVIQAGLYSNPNVGYEGDTAGTGGTAGYQGGFVEQAITLGGKIKLAQAAALMDLHNAELALRRARYDLLSQVRAGYFGVLVAEQNLKITHALARFTEEVFRVQVEQVKGAQAAAYEPLQLRVLAMQARSAVVQAHNRYAAAWKELAATLGLPALPATELAGSVDMPIPIFRYDAALGRVLQSHTDVLTAETSIQQARYQLRLAQVTPVPDLFLRAMVQKDFTTPPNLVAPSIVVSAPIPIWDRNQGGIIQGQGNLLHAVEEVQRVRNDLTSQLASAFERYENNRIIVNYYRDQILPDQVRAYRGVYERHQQDPDRVSFGDIINAQQTLASTVTTYVATLGNQWSAAVELANLLQLDNLFHVQTALAETECVAPIPDLEHLPDRKK